MEGGEALLVVRLDGDGLDVFVAEGFKESFGIGFVGLVPVPVPANTMRRKQDHRVTQALEKATPVVGGAAGFEQNASGLLLDHESLELCAREPVVLGNLAWVVGDGELKDGLGKIDGDGMLHGDSSLLWPAIGP